MPNDKGEGFVDYVLWGDDGLPLAVVEAKRTRKDSRIGQQQAKLYADCLERMKGQRPIIFFTNGYETWLWDDLNYPPRKVQGFYKKDELQLLINRRTSIREITSATINKAIVERYYQHEAIRRVGRGFPAAQAAQGAAGHGHRHRQDPHRDRPDRTAAEVQLDQAGAVPGRPDRAADPGRQRLQGASAPFQPGQHHQDQGRHHQPDRALHLSDHDELHRRGQGGATSASAPAIST